MIDGIDDYIIKSYKGEPFFFNTRVNLKLQRNLIDRQELLPDIGFPIGYSRNQGVVSGTIIPFYNDAVSLNNIFYIYPLSDLKKYYNHDDNEIDNLMKLFLDILKIISRMHEKGVVYTDIRSANFVLDHNEVKIIDFDLGYVWFKDKKYFYCNIILVNYCSMIQKILRERYHYQHVFLHRGDDFIETEDRIRMLCKSLRS